jgi:hypothetical protein
MYRASVACDCGNEFEAEATRNETDSRFRCECGARYLLTVTRIEFTPAN